MLHHDHALRLRLYTTTIIHSLTRPPLRPFSNHNHNHKKYTKVPALRIARVSISPQHKLSNPATAILQDPSHVLYPVVRQRYAHVLNGGYDVLQEGLWLMFTGNLMNRKKVVRSWAKRRVVRAVTEELRGRGFDRFGRRVEGGAGVDMLGGGKKGSGVPEVLVGTVDVEVTDESIEKKYLEVQRQAKLLVQEVLKICGRQMHTDGKPVQSSAKLRPRYHVDEYYP